MGFSYSASPGGPRGLRLSIRPSCFGSMTGGISCRSRQADSWKAARPSKCGPSLLGSNVSGVTWLRLQRRCRQKNATRPPLPPSNHSFTLVKRKRAFVRGEARQVLVPTSRTRPFAFLTPHRPPRRVRIPRAVSSDAIARNETCPAARMSSNTGARSVAEAAAFADTTALTPTPPFPANPRLSAPFGSPASPHAPWPPQAPPSSFGGLPPALPERRAP
jgi:hypothetical protein